MKPTKAELRWLERLQAVLDECPSKRLASLTTGDPVVTVFVKSTYDCYMLENPEAESRNEIGQIVEDAGAVVCMLKFPFQVWSTAG
jgi:hypothetical protein